MNLSEYKAQVGRIPYGKRLPGAVYVHRAGLAEVGGELGKLLDQVVGRYEVTEAFNLVKFRTDELKVSFLSYPGFDAEAHPALERAITVDLVAGKARRTDYTGNANPPILHRKETFVSAGYPGRAEFEALTRAEEAAGLYENTATIGFKLNWEKLLARKGVVIRGHKLEKVESGKQKAEIEKAEPWGEEGGLRADGGAGQTEGNEENEDPSGGAEGGPQRSAGLTLEGGVVIERHKTALTRYELSKPVKTLLRWRSGFQTEGCSAMNAAW